MDSKSFLRKHKHTYTWKQILNRNGYQKVFIVPTVSLSIFPLKLSDWKFASRDEYFCTRNLHKCTWDKYIFTSNRVEYSWPRKISTRRKHYPTRHRKICTGRKHDPTGNELFYPDNKYSCTGNTCNEWCNTGNINFYIA